MKIGDRVTVKKGCDYFMQYTGRWADWDCPIDDKSGVIVEDYTDLSGADCHYAIDFGGEYHTGVHPDFLKEQK